MKKMIFIFIIVSLFVFPYLAKPISISEASSDPGDQLPIKEKMVCPSCGFYWKIYEGDFKKIGANDEVTCPKCGKKALRDDFAKGLIEEGRL